MKRRTTLFLLAVTAVALATRPAFCADSKHTAEGISAYNARNYAESAQMLEAAVSANPNDAKAHYYLALTYQALHRFDDAKREYNWNYQHKKDKSLAYQSWQGLVALQKSRSTLSHGSTPAPTAAAMVGSLDSAPPDHAPTAGQPVAVKSTPLNYKFEWKAGCPRHGGGM